MDFRNKDPGAVQYGNFINYYQFSSAEEIIKLLPSKTTWKSMNCYTTGEQPYLVLDVGCNSGELTKQLYQYLKQLMPETDIRILAVDLDANLIQRAQLNNNNNNNDDVGGNSIVYECINVMLEEDFRKITQYLEAYNRKQFDVVCCFSITMWIHLNYNDCGLQEFLRTFSSLAKLFVLEPQSWKCYQNAQRRMRKAKTEFPLFLELKWRTDIEQQIDNFLQHVLDRRKVYESKPTKWNRCIRFFI